MLNEIKKTDVFYDYYEKWITVYKKGAVRDVTLDKYHLTHQWIGKLAPYLKLCENLPRVERGVVYFFTGKALAPRRRVKHVSGLPFACCSTYAFYS